MFAKKRKNRSSRTKSNRLSCENLEGRRLFAVISGLSLGGIDAAEVTPDNSGPSAVVSTPLQQNVDTSKQTNTEQTNTGMSVILRGNGMLRIGGTNDPNIKDSVNVSSLPDGRIRLGLYTFTKQGRLIAQDEFFYNSANVTELVFFGYAGDDTFSNSTNLPVEAYGGDGRDHLIGGGNDDVLHGGNGDDIIYGGYGDDTIRGGRHKDRLSGGMGNDNIDGGTSEDRIFGDYGNDTLRGGRHDDYIRGGHGHDLIFGGDDDDTIWGDRGNDLIYGNAGDDRIFGDHRGVGLTNAFGGHDVIYGGSGKDVLWGHGGHDRMYGGSGKDVLHGGDGSDYMNGGSNGDTLYGNAGWDVLDGGKDKARDRLSGGAGRDTVIIHKYIFSSGLADIIEYHARERVETRWHWR